tara:strand:+ start:752 stop:955 length:204 start_codon:yes stop_codon:yes gene_type:complete
MKKAILILATFFTLIAKADVITSRTYLDNISINGVNLIKSKDLVRKASPKTFLEDILMVPGPNRGGF